MLCRGLKTMDELEEAEGKEKQMERERVIAKATAKPFNNLTSAPKQDVLDPFARIDIPLLPP